MYQIISLILEGYYYNNNRTSDRETISTNSTNKFVQKYTNFFFDKNDAEVLCQGDIVHDYYKGRYPGGKDKYGNDIRAKVVYYTFKSKETKNETIHIFSVKGTTTKTDVFIDAQLFLPSAFLTLTRNAIPLVPDLNSMTYKHLEAAFTLPFRSLKKLTVIDQYVDQMYETIEHLSAPLDDSSRVMIVGHSLGGGLSKVLAKKMKRTSVSLSGPGITMISNIYDYRSNVSRNTDFFSSFIDIVPDFDIVPRVENSGGTIYRLLCTGETFQCHSSDRSLCASMITCNATNYCDYCKLVDYSDEQIQEYEKRLGYLYHCNDLDDPLI